MLGREIDLLKNYPKAKRNLEQRLEEKSEAVRAVAREFDKDFFDGERKYGYGGFSYHPRFWTQVVRDFSNFYHLKSNASLLDVGCAKGFMLYDFFQFQPSMHLAGIDVSQYAIEHAVEDIKSFVQVGNAIELPFKDNSFDLVISINTIHNLDKEQCRQALQEIQRVSQGQAFITVDAYRDQDEKTRMLAWNLTAKTIMHVDEWKAFFKEAGYTGDFYWFIP